MTISASSTADSANTCDLAGHPAALYYGAAIATASIAASLVAIAVLMWRLVGVLQQAVHLQRLSLHNPAEHPTDVESDDESVESTSSGSSIDAGSESPLEHSRNQFRACLMGPDDVNVEKFMNACQTYAETLKILGGFAGPMIREVNNQMKKICQTYQKDPDKHKSMKALLQAEVDAGRHKEGAILDDPSSAMGLIWARRALVFWVHLYEQVLKVENGEQPDLKKCAQVAYEASLKPFNGFVSRRSFSSMVIGRFPEWKKMRARLAPRQRMQADLSNWVTEVKALVYRMETIQKEAGLEDRRKSI